MDPITFTVSSFSIPYSKLYLTSTLRLNQFQAEVYKLLGEGKDILLTAPTGGGKTLTLLLNPDVETGSPGFVAVYPNNTLMLNQLCTVEDIIVEHFGANLVETIEHCETGICNDSTGIKRRCECYERNPERRCVEPLTIYKIDESRMEGSWEGPTHIALLLLSGKYIVSRSAPKRESVYNIAKKVLSYRRRGGVYTIIFTTPDTYLLLWTGAYRDFEGVGKTLHNMLLAIAEGKDLETVLRKTGVLARSLVDKTVSTVQRLLNKPLFIDEFHLYSPYEVDALNAILALHRQIMEKPVVFSSATPAEDILEELKSVGIKPVRITARIVNSARGFPVRGETIVNLITVPTERKGLSAYFDASSSVPMIVLDELMERLAALGDGRALLVLERLWMVAELARALHSRGLDVECIASIFPRGSCRPGSKIIVGSEATTQGVNLGRVVLGVTGGTSYEDVIQRIGRVGRKGVDSELYLVVPENALSAITFKSRLDYWGLVEVIRTLYPDYPKRKRDVSNLIPNGLRMIRRKLIASLGMVSIARVSGIKQFYNKININNDVAIRLLDSVIGGPQIYTGLVVFRRTGFSVRYIVADTGDSGETSIGIITRNFKIKGITRDGKIVIDLVRNRTPLRIHTLGDPSPFSGKLVSLKFLLKTLGGRIELGENHIIEESQIEDTLVYIADTGESISDYLSYTGEGAEIHSPTGRRYSVIFI